MSEDIIPTPTAADLAPYVDDVQKRAAEWLAIHPGGKRRTEIREPEKAALALYLLDHSGLAINKVADAVGLAHAEVGRLIYNRPELWEKRRPHLAIKLAATTERLIDVTEQKLDRISENEEQLDATPLKDIALSLGIISDKAAAFNGMSTTVVEHRTGPTIEDAMKFREEIRQRLADKAKNEAIDV